MWGWSLFPTFASTFIKMYFLKSKDEVECAPEDEGGSNPGSRRPACPHVGGA